MMNPFLYESNEQRFMRSIFRPVLFWNSGSNANAALIHSMPKVSSGLKFHVSLTKTKKAHVNENTWEFIIAS